MTRQDFETWSHDALVQFANETYVRIVDDMYEIEALKKDLKDAINAYRHINTTRSYHDKKENENNCKML
jgi:adenine C2-methylase RlmN of 23S rRNA A2503 and tRNA A37